MAVHTQLYLKDNGKISEFAGSENHLPVKTFQLAYLSSTEDLYIVYNKHQTVQCKSLKDQKRPRLTSSSDLSRDIPKKG